MQLRALNRVALAVPFGTCQPSRSDKPMTKIGLIVKSITIKVSDKE